MPDEHWKHTPDEHDYPAARPIWVSSPNPKPRKPSPKRSKTHRCRPRKQRTCCAPANSPSCPQTTPRYARTSRRPTTARSCPRSSWSAVSSARGRSPSLTATTASVRATTSATTPTSPTEWSTCPRANQQALELTRLDGQVVTLRDGQQCAMRSPSRSGRGNRLRSAAGAGYTSLRSNGRSRAWPARVSPRRGGARALA